MVSGGTPRRGLSVKGEAPRLPGTLAAAYSATGGAWQEGPGPIYDRLAAVLVARSPGPVAGRHALDVGAGTGAASRALLAAGAVGVVALDSAAGMLAHGRQRRPPAVVGDAVALPFVAAAFDVAIAAFSLNHLPEPAAGLREMTRVTRPGGSMVIATYASDDSHPVKAAVESALTDRGWSPEPWYLALRSELVPRMATPEGCHALIREVGLDAVVEPVRVTFPELDAAALVAWRLGMAQHAPFVTSLPETERVAVAETALARLGPDTGPLVRSILVMAAVRP